jgi:hypothetical protein
MSRFAKIVFGPMCPESLRVAIHHAERLAAATEQAHADVRRFARPGAERRTEPGAREAWLIGRAAEIEAFVLDVLHDWRARLLLTHEAVSALERYLEAVHGGMASCVLGGVRPPCCSLDELITRESPPLSEGYSGGWDASSARTIVREA